MSNLCFLTLGSLTHEKKGKAKVGKNLSAKYKVSKNKCLAKYFGRCVTVSEFGRFLTDAVRRYICIRRKSKE